MANVIIKPSSGGSTILQDESGTAAITIDASGNSTIAAMSDTTSFPVRTTINHKVYEYNTRTSLQNRLDFDAFYSFPYNKTVASSDMVVTAMLPFYNDSGGTQSIAFRYNSTVIHCGLYEYEASGYGIVGYLHGVLTGHTTTGEQMLSIGHDVNGSGASAPAVVFCPNAQDEDRMFQTISSASVFEILK
jgi:hypothetical protein